MNKIITNGLLVAAAAAVGTLLDPSMAFAGTGAEIVQGIEGTTDLGTRVVGTVAGFAAACIGFPMAVSGASHGLGANVAARATGLGLGLGGPSAAAWLNLGGGAGMNFSTLLGA